MEVAASLAAPRPQIVFCTAYDEYAVDAFELHAVDYLLKPVSRARLAKAIERAASPNDAAIDRAAESSGSWPTRFLGKRRSRYCVVGGPGAFYVVADGFEDFADAILRKMLLEIAGRRPPPEPKLWPAASVGHVKM